MKQDVNKPDAPQSPQISICARDLMRDIFSNYTILLVCWHRSAVSTQFRSGSVTQSFLFVLKRTNHNPKKKRKLNSILVTVFAHSIHHFIFFVRFPSTFFHTFADVFRMKQFEISKIYGNCFRILMANGLQDAVFAVNFGEILSDCK